MNETTPGIDPSQQYRDIGIEFYRIPDAQGDRVIAGDSGLASGANPVMYSILDPSALGIDTSKLRTMDESISQKYNNTSGRIYATDQFRSYANNARAQLDSRNKVAAEEARVSALNSFIDKYRGSTASAEVPKELDPTGEYAIYNGAFVRKENIPALSGLTSVGGNIVGGAATAPVGSAADLLQQGIAAGTVSATNPTQQFNASMQGNNVTAPGIAPVAPAAPAPVQQVLANTQEPEKNLQPEITPETVSAVYKVGNDIYVVSNGRPTKLDNADAGSAFQRLGINASFLPASGAQVTLSQAQTGVKQRPQTISSTTPASTGMFSLPTVTPTTSPLYDTNLVSGGLGGVAAASQSYTPKASVSSDLASFNQSMITPELAAFNKSMTSGGALTGDAFAAMYNKTALPGQNTIEAGYNTQVIKDNTAPNGYRITTISKPEATAGREFGRIGNDIFEITKDANGVEQYRHIGPSEFQMSGLNVDFIKSVQNTEAAKAALAGTGSQPSGWAEVTDTAAITDLYKNTSPNLPKAPVTGKTGVPTASELSTTRTDQKAYTQSELDTAINESVKNALANQPQIPPISFEDVGSFSTELKALQDKLNGISDPMAGKTFAATYKELAENPLGGKSLVDLYKDKVTAQQNLDTLGNVLFNLKGAIDEDPDLPQKIKSANFTFIDRKNASAINILQSQVKALDNAIADREKYISNTMDVYYKDYAKFSEQKKDIQLAIDKLNAVQDKASDNARAAINGLLSNPELASGITTNEVNYILKNGVYPASMIQRISASVTGKADELKNVFHEVDKNGTIHVYGTQGGKLVELGSQSGFKAAGSSGTANNRYKDVVQSDGSTVRYYEDGRKVTFPSGGVKLTTAQTQQAFTAWLNSYKGKMTESRIKEEATKAGVTITDADAKKYSTTDKGWLWFDSGVDQTVPAFNSYTASLYGTQQIGGGGGDGQSVYNPQTGEKYPISGFTPDELADAKTQGWIIQ